MFAIMFSNKDNAFDLLDESKFEITNLAIFPNFCIFVGINSDNYCSLKLKYQLPFTENSLLIFVFQIFYYLVHFKNENLIFLVFILDFFLIF